MWTPESETFNLNTKEGNIFSNGGLSNSAFRFSLMALIGVLMGAVILLIGGLPYKWVFAIVATAVCLPLLVVAIGSLQKALVAILIFSLSIGMDVHLGFSDKYATLQSGVPISLTSLLLLCLYTHWLFNLRRGARSIRLFPWVTIPFGVLVLWSGLSFLVAAKPSYVLSRFPRALEAFFIYFYVANSLKSEKDIHFLIKCLAVTLALTGMLVLCQYFVGDSYNLQFLGGRELQLEPSYYALKISRASGFLGHANSLAFFLGGLLPLLLVCAVGIDMLRMRLLCLLSFALGLMALVLTYSRGGWLAFIFALVLIGGFLMTRQVRKNFGGAFVRVVFLALAAAFLILPFAPTIVTRLTKDDHGAAYSRIPMAQTALNVARHNWVTGVGLGNYKIAVWDYDPDPALKPDGSTEPVHNIYLHTAAELGVPALALFIWILVAFFGGGIHALRTANKTTALFAVGVIAGLGGQCLHGMFELGTFGHPRFVYLSFMGGLLVALGQSVKQKRPPLLTEGNNNCP